MTLCDAIIVTRDVAEGTLLRDVIWVVMSVKMTQYTNAFYHLDCQYFAKLGNSFAEDVWTRGNKIYSYMCL